MHTFIFIVTILSGVAVWLFQYMNQKRKIRQEEMHERKRQQFEELLKLIGDKNPADEAQTSQGGEPPMPGSGRAGTTKAEEN